MFHVKHFLAVISLLVMKCKLRYAIESIYYRYQGESLIYISFPIGYVPFSGVLHPRKNDDNPVRGRRNDESMIYPLIPISLSEPLADSRARKRAAVGICFT